MNKKSCRQSGSSAEEGLGTIAHRFASGERRSGVVQSFDAPGAIRADGHFLDVRLRFEGESFARDRRLGAAREADQQGIRDGDDEQQAKEGETEGPGLQCGGRFEVIWFHDESEAGRN